MVAANSGPQKDDLALAAAIMMMAANLKEGFKEMTKQVADSNEKWMATVARLSSPSPAPTSPGQAAASASGSARRAPTSPLSSGL